MKKRVGFVAIVGRPNVGKSTLLNLMVGEKLAPVSDKPQTTRGVVRGICTQAEGQIIFIDTPGHHAPQDDLGRWMIGEIEKSLEAVDLLYWMVLPKKPGFEDQKILELLSSRKVPLFLVMNQVDRYPKPSLLPSLDAYQKMHAFKELIPISAKTGDQVPLLVKKTFEYLPEGELLYPEDQISDQQERFFVQELIREKIFIQTDQEVPYAASVMIEEFKERNDKLVDIRATVLVEKQSQKAIMIGKNGDRMKQIGQEARLEIEKMLGKKVFLQLWVKVLPGWKENASHLKELGYD